MQQFSVETVEMLDNRDGGTTDCERNRLIKFCLTEGDGDVVVVMMMMIYNFKLHAFHISKLRHFGLLKFQYLRHLEFEFKF
jgi:hypothetical protein